MVKRQDLAKSIWEIFENKNKKIWFKLTILLTLIFKMLSNVSSVEFKSILHSQ